MVYTMVMFLVDLLQLHDRNQQPAGHPRRRLSRIPRYTLLFDTKCLLREKPQGEVPMILIAAIFQQVLNHATNFRIFHCFSYIQESSKKRQSGERLRKKEFEIGVLKTELQSTTSDLIHANQQIEMLTSYPKSSTQVRQQYNMMMIRIVSIFSVVHCEPYSSITMSMPVTNSHE